jgi:DnaJ family protein C protein 27
MRFRFIILGDAGTGKSCLIKRYCESSRFAGTKYMPTIGVDYGTKTSTIPTTNDTSHPPLTVKIDFFDLSGDSNYIEVRNEFYTNVDGVILTFDVTNKRSFESLRTTWQEEVGEYGFTTPSAMTTVIIVGTKIDNRTREVTEQDGLAFAIQNNVTYFETSAKTGEGVDVIFEYMLQELTRKQLTKAAVAS